MQQEILISQDDINNINILPVENQAINLNNVINDNINISQEQNQNINIKQEDNQTIYIDDEGVAYNITDVLVNGVSVVSNNIAYVVVPTKLSELENNVGFITQEIDPTVPMYIKQITLSDISNWNNKQDLLVSGTNIKTINNTSLLGSGNININPSYTAGTGINITNNVISNTITSYNDLTNLPTIPEYTGDLINNSGFVSSNELSEVAFNGSYNALSDTPIIPDSTSELTNDSGFIDKNVNDLTYYTLSSSLSTVATSGSYNDLSNKPTIPTVNDATLTIQKNGTTVNTFTANASSNVTANITVPTKTSDLTNDSGFIDKNANDLTYYTLSSSLSTVATSGSYNDLSSKPLIPNIYSSNEVEIGTWIDGKTIYRKVFTGGTLPSNSTLEYDVSNLNIDSICNLYGGAIQGSSKYRPLPLVANPITNGLRYDVDNSKIRVTTFANWSGWTVNVIIEYTKK